jgi:hypothetical protein
MVDNDVTLNAVIDVLAERLAARVRLDLAQTGGGGVKPRLFSVEEAAVYLGRSKEAVEHILDVWDLGHWIEANKIWQIYLHRFSLD